MANGFLVNALVYVAAAAWAALLAYQGWVIPRSFFGPLSTVVAVVSGGLFLFDKFLWRSPGFSLLAHRPDLRGTWTGRLLSNHKQPDGSSTPESNVFVVVWQTYSSLQFRLLSEESTSDSLAASVLRREDDTYELALVYLNVPKQSVRNRSQIHRGSLVLRVGGVKDAVLEGAYWTDRQTSGELVLQRVSRKRATNLVIAKNLAET
jgi:hypothetical protein